MGSRHSSFCKFISQINHQGGCSCKGCLSVLLLTHQGQDYQWFNIVKPMLLVSLALNSSPKLDLSLSHIVSTLSGITGVVFTQWVCFRRPWILCCLRLTRIQQDIIAAPNILVYKKQTININFTHFNSLYKLYLKNRPYLQFS